MSEVTKENKSADLTVDGIDPTVQEKHAQKDRRPKRTRGLKIFDGLLYAFSNFAIFAISLYATYCTDYGDKMKGWLPKALHSRGKKVTDWLESKGMSKGAAQNSKMVFFSFADGTLFAPVIKLLEDRREKIAKGIDVMLGTKPEDESVYAAEPKQSWGSVILGRLMTVSIVVPTAILLQNTPVKVKDPKATGGYKKSNLNDYLFRDPGIRAGKWTEKNLVNKFEWLQKATKNIELDGLFKASLFEMVYTTICTVGLYFSSRLLARFWDKDKDERVAEAKSKVEASQKSDSDTAPKASKPSKGASKTAAKEVDEEQEAEQSEPKRFSKKEQRSKNRVAAVQKQENQLAETPLAL